MAKLARFVMRYAAETGFRAIQIDTFDDRVFNVWLEPPAPFKGSRISHFNTWEYTEEETFRELTRDIYPFGDAHQTINKVFVELKPKRK